MGAHPLAKRNALLSSCHAGWIDGRAVPRMTRRSWLAAYATALFAHPLPRAIRHTTVAIDGDRFLIDGRPTYAGRTWRGNRIEGLLMNARMVQGIFDDLNPATQQLWAYPDTKRWDAERNTREFTAAMPEWRRHGLLAFTLNLQGGSPQGYSQTQPWHNSAFYPNGSYAKPICIVSNRCSIRPTSSAWS